ncbi:hypothetical protein BC939DRAFT_72710 [Gamsiella multidivaricata]|uniref:uncharacterized protein n=1 Tax=Gamsiella multidivaricata TaxID=101098 RepID=UPI0022208AE1|nr:uncharacterized protein BC939DRAFT_72710 [Gamsiella multidivaricata]KAI7828261.1 hypothetical protein BC939DRAFT_72710 [Gamsiella multidivaricata]
MPLVLLLIQSILIQVNSTHPFLLCCSIVSVTVSPNNQFAYTFHTSAESQKKGGGGEEKEGIRGCPNPPQDRHHRQAPPPHSIIFKSAEGSKGRVPLYGCISGCPGPPFPPMVSVGSKRSRMFMPTAERVPEHIEPQSLQSWSCWGTDAALCT